MSDPGRFRLWALLRAFALVAAASPLLLGSPGSASAMSDCPGIVEVDGITKVGIEGSQTCDASACPAAAGTLADVVAGLCNVGIAPVECGICQCCRSDAASLWTGTDATLSPGGDPADFCEVGGRGQALGEAAVCLLRDLSQPARAPSLGEAGIHLAAEVPLPVGTVTAQQRIGLLEFSHDAGGTQVRAFHSTGYCLPGLGCIDGQSQTFTANLVHTSGGNGACDAYTLENPWKLDITADEQQFNLGVGVGPILIPIPVGAISLRPRLDYESNQQAVTSPWNGGNDSSRVPACFDTNFTDATDPAQISFAASSAALDGGLVDGWKSLVGLGGRDPRIGTAIWDPAGEPFPLRPDYDFTTARSSEEKRPGTRFHGGLRVAYSLADLLEALGIPASFPPFYLDELSVYVQSDVDAAISSQFQLSASEGSPDSGPDCNAHPSTELRLESSLATVAQLLVKAGFRFAFTLDLGFFEKTFRIQEEVPVVGLTPDAQTVYSPVASTGLDIVPPPTPGQSVNALDTFSAPSPADGVAYIEDCLTLPPPPVQAPPVATSTPGDPLDLAAAVQIPCNICLYLPDSITSACVPKVGVDPTYDCGLGVNGMACDDPNCENRAVNPPVSANVQRVLQGVSQASLPPDRQWACDAVAKNGCYDTCTFDPYAEQPMVIVQSAVDLKGTVCRDGLVGEVATPRVCAVSGCDDGNAGTTDSCDGGGNCVHTPLSGTPCDDGMWCNGADTYQNGQCTGHAGNPCFAAGDCCMEETDSCVDHCPTSPCDGKAPNDACDDGTACTVGDVCTTTDAGLQCRGTAALTCTSADACSTSLCDDSGGVAACVEHDNGTCPRCGNGILDSGETCDDGNEVTGDGCDANCQPTGCGNGAVSAGEACDDGNAASGDGCDSNCTPSACGNGVTAGSEGCDDGNASSGDGCDANCTPTACGNGVLTFGEQCDDGNHVNNDGCQANCQVTACTPLITTNCAVEWDHLNYAKEITGPHVVENLSQAQYLTRSDDEDPDFQCLGNDDVERSAWYAYTAPVGGYLRVDASGTRSAGGDLSEQDDYVVGVVRPFIYHAGGPTDSCFNVPHSDTYYDSFRVEGDRRYLIVMGAPPYVNLYSSESYRLELTLMPDPLVPATNIHVARSGNDVLVTWDELSSEEFGYRIWRRNSVSDFSPVNVGSVSSNFSSYLDAGAGADCGFRIYDVSVVGNGVPGDYDGGEFYLRPCAPVNDDVANAKAVSGSDYTDSVPHGAGATVAGDDTPAACSFLPTAPLLHSVWYKVTPAADGTLSVNMAGTTGIPGWFTALQVFEGSPGSLTTVACANSPTEHVYSSISDLPVQAGHDYYIELGNVGVSPSVVDFTYAVHIQLSGGVVPPALTPPTSLGGTRGSGSDLSLTWDDPNSDETGYELEVSTNDGALWSPLQTTAANAASLNLNDASCLASLYRVRALRNAETSAWTTSATVAACDTAPPLSAPSALAALRGAGFAQTQVTLTWDDPNSDETGYELEVSTNAGALWSPVATTAAGATLSNIDPASCLASLYRVRALRNAESSAWTVSPTLTACGPVSLPPDAALCQAAIGKAAAKMLQARLTALQTCRNLFNAGKPQFTDAAKTSPVVDVEACNVEFKTAAAIAKAGATMHKKIAKKCSDADVAALSACAPGVDGLGTADGSAGCLLAMIATSADAMIGEEYGRSLAPGEDAERGCQQALAKAGGIYANARVKAVEGCLAKLAGGDAQYADAAHTVPVTTLAQCASEVAAAAKIAKAGAVARKLIAKPGKALCTDALVVSLASTCAQTVDGLVSADGAAGCLLSGHAAAGGFVLEAAY